MPDDITSIAAILSLLAGFATTVGLACWRNQKGRTSIFAQDAHLESVGFSLIASLFDSRSMQRIDGITEMRPPWGMRLLAPGLASFLFLTTDLSPLWHSVGINDPRVHVTFLSICCALTGYSWFMLLFFQKVVYDRAQIECSGVDISHQHRDLSDLVDIHVHKRRPALVLTFAHQKPLYIPKFLSGRAKFVTEMEAIAQQNLAQGLTAPAPTLASQLGF